MALGAFVGQHGLLHEAVAVGASGFEPVDAHAVQPAGAASADVRVVVSGAFRGIEVRSVVGCDLHPCGCIERGGPYDGEPLVGRLLEPGAAGDPHGGLRRGGSRDEKRGERYEMACFHRLVVQI